MQVMCVISPIGWMIAAHIAGCGCPNVGDILTVKEQRRSTCCNGSHYVYDFEEYSLLQQFDARCFAILPEADANDIDAAEQEAIVPSPLIVESDALSIEEKALKAYYQVYEVTGDERRAADVYFQILQNPLP